MISNLTNIFQLGWNHQPVSGIEASIQICLLGLGHAVDFWRSTWWLGWFHCCWVENVRLWWPSNLFGVFFEHVVCFWNWLLDIVFKHVAEWESGNNEWIGWWSLQMKRLWGGGWACFAWKTVPRIVRIFFTSILWMNSMKHGETFSKPSSRWWFQIFFMFTLILGKIPILTNIFQLSWLKPPTRWIYKSKTTQQHVRHKTQPGLPVRNCLQIQESRSKDSRILPIHLKNPPTATAEKSLWAQKDEAGWSWILWGRGHHEMDERPLWFQTNST